MIFAGSRTQLARALALGAVTLSAGCTIQNYYASPPPAGVASASPAAGPSTASTPLPEPATAAPGGTDPASASASAGAPPAPATPPPLGAVSIGQHPRGLLLYSQYRYSGGRLVHSGPVLGLDPDAPGSPLTLVPGSSGSALAHGGLLGGWDYDDKAHWVMDMRRSPTSAIRLREGVDAFTSDGRIVHRCAGNPDNDFELCTYDATGNDRRVVLRVPPVPFDAAAVRGAGGSRVLVVYASSSRAPFAYDLSTNQRRELPSFWRGRDATPVFAISPSGAHAAACFQDDPRATLVVTDLSGKRPDRTFSFGTIVRCECRFAPDDRAIACSFLPKNRPRASKWDRLVSIDLGTGRQAVVHEEISIGHFVFSPDGSELAYPSYLGDREPGQLVISPTFGGQGRTVSPFPVEQQLIGWVKP